MNDSMARLLAEIGIDRNAVTSSRRVRGGYDVRLTERVTATWSKLAAGFPATGYWPVIRGVGSEVVDPDHIEDPARTLARVPAGGIDEILAPLLKERIQSYREVADALGPGAQDAVAKILSGCDHPGIEQAVAVAQAVHEHNWGRRTALQDEWPSTRRVHRYKARRLRLQTLKGYKSGQVATISLVLTENRYEVPAHLGFGGWNECPRPEIHVAVLREWQGTYGAVPVCVARDVLECVVMRPPQEEADAMTLAAQHWLFCDDIVDQGTQSVRALARELWKSPTWFFWWD